MYLKRSGKAPDILKTLAVTVLTITLCGCQPQTASSSDPPSSERRFLLYFLICACGWGISSWLIHILEGVINVYVLKIGVMVLVTLFQYFMNKYITYRK